MIDFAFFLFGVAACWGIFRLGVHWERERIEIEATRALIQRSRREIGHG